jgi:hypothetical protein
MIKAGELKWKRKTFKIGLYNLQYVEGFSLWLAKKEES